ncbi:MAG: TonB-dependent receptor [Fimbriimonadaceae bacterium]|nr:TonB-dependent receptor [Chitinophagales bacterium]
MSKVKIILIVFVLAVFSANKINAQVGGEEVDVVVGYNPILADAVKVDIQGEIPKTGSKPDTLSYNVKTDLFKVAYRPLKVNPIALPKDKPEELENVYAKAGFGTQITPLLEAYINSNRSDKYNFGIYGKYISSQGALENQDFSDLDVGASAKFFFNKKIAVPLNIFYNNDVLHYYGYNNEDTVLSFTSKEVKQRFDYFGFNTGFENIVENTVKIDYKIRGGFTRINDINKYNEINPFVSAFVETQLENGHETGGTLLIDHYQYNGPNDYKNTIIGVKPHYNIINDDWSVKAAFEFNIDDNGEFKPLPDAEFSKDLIGDKLVFIVGADSYLKRNSFKNLTDENPFLADTIVFENSVFYEYYGGIRGSTYGNFSFNLKGYIKDIKDMVFFVNDSNDLKRFDIIYDDAKITGVNVELSYFTAGKLRILGAVNAFAFSDLSIDKPLHTPTLDWTFSTDYHFNKKLQAGFDVFGANKSYALLPGNTIETIDGTVDINFAATYKYSKYFNLFVQVNNIMGTKYERFYNYPGYGFQALGGLSFSF